MDVFTDCVGKMDSVRFNQANILKGRFVLREPELYLDFIEYMMAEVNQRILSTDHKHSFASS